ncbi:MAG: hypothetical protein AAF670_13755 [Planctomycetota bacterium]
MIKFSKTDGSKPYKGKLIDLEEYEETGSPGCMCAQGQALCFLGDKEPYYLDSLDQEDADHMVAELLGISLGHSVLLRDVNDSKPGSPANVLESPGEVLGEHADLILKFWKHLDGLGYRYHPEDPQRSWDADNQIDLATASLETGHSRTATDESYRNHQAIMAVMEIVGHKKLNEFFYLPQFGFETIDALRRAEV